MSFLFGKKPVDPKEQAREWNRNLQKEIRNFEKQIRQIEMSEKKVKIEVKKAARQDMDAARSLAKELVRSQKAKERIYTLRATLHSVQMQIKAFSATQRVVSTVGQTAGLMQSLNSMMRAPEVRAVATAMSKEMTKAGIIEEMVEESFEAIDDPDMDELADGAVDQVMSEIMSEYKTKAPSAGKASVNVQEVLEEEDAKAAAEMEERLQQLRAAE